MPVIKTGNRQLETVNVYSYLSEIGILDPFIVSQVFGIPLGHNPALGKHVSVIGNGKSLSHVLFHQKNRNLLLSDLLNDPEILLHQQGRKSQGWLINNQ